MAINHLFPWSVVDDDGWFVLQIFQVSTKWGCYTLLTRDPSNATMSFMGLSFSNADLSLRQLLGAKCRTKPQDHRHFKLLRGEPHAINHKKPTGMVSIRPILGLPHCLLLSFWIWRKLPNEHPVATLVGQTSDSLNLPRTNDYPCSLGAHSWLVVSTLMEQRRNNKLKPPTRKYHGQSWTPLLNRKLAGSFNT